MNNMTSTEIQIRPACPADSEALVSLILVMALESEGRKLDEPVLKAGVASVFDNSALGTYWVLTTESGLIGCTLITTEWSDWNNAPYWWIQSLYIKPEFRGQHLFENLLARLEQAARQSNVAELRLYVETNNQRAIRVYERNGFDAGHYRCMTKALN
jgi:ribosomal protein S18 acetylase RimI-like enzyme